MSLRRNRDKDFTGLDNLIEEIIVETYGNDDQLWAFRQVFENNIIPDRRDDKPYRANRAHNY